MITQRNGGTITVPQKAIGAAVTPDGNAAANSMNVYNQIVGDKELHIQLTVAGGSDITDVVFLFGAWNTATTIKSGVGFTADGFASFAEFKQYFMVINTAITSVRMESDDATNFKNMIKFVERDPTGENKTVKKRLDKYRVAVGNGYSETIEMGVQDMGFVIWPGVEVSLDKIKAGSVIDIYLGVTGWNKQRTLNPLAAAII